LSLTVRRVEGGGKKRGKKLRGKMPFLSPGLRKKSVVYSFFYGKKKKGGRGPAVPREKE